MDIPNRLLMSSNLRFLFFLLQKLGLNVVNVMWEDTARTPGSVWGANITDMTGGYANFCFFKYHSNGMLNTSFGTNGFVLSGIGGAGMSNYPAPISHTE